MDDGPSRVHGARPVQLHGVTPALGDRRVGIRDRPGRTCSVPSANMAYSLYAMVLGGLCLVTDCGLRPRAGCTGRPGRRHRHCARRRHRRRRGGRPGARFLPGLAPARAVAPHQGAGQPTLALLLPAALPLLGQHPRLHPVGALACWPSSWAGRWFRQRFVQRIGGVQPVAPSPGRSPWRCWAAWWRPASRPTARASSPTTSAVSRNGQIAQYITEWNSPNFHSVMTLLVYCVPLAVLVACASGRDASRSLRSRSALLLFVEALQTQRLVVYLLVVAAGVAATLPMRRALGDDGPSVGGRRTGGPGHRHRGHSRGAGRAGGVVPAGRGLQLPGRAPGPDLHASTRGATTRSPATGPPSSTGARTSSRARCSPSSWR